MKDKIMKESVYQVKKAKRRILYIGIFSFCAIFVLAIVEFVVKLNPTYAAVTPEKAPSYLTAYESTHNSVSMFSSPKINEFEEADHIIKAELYHPRISEEQYDNYKVDESSIMFISNRNAFNTTSVYCLLKSASQTKYSGITYIIENQSIFKDYYKNNISDLVEDSIVTEEEFVAYMTQIAIWWYIDIQNGYSSLDLDSSSSDSNYVRMDNNSIISVGQDESEYWYEGYFDSYNFVNNLSVADKNTIRNSEYWEGLKSILTGALNYTIDTTEKEISINENNISYQIMDNALLTSNISVYSDNDSFSSYTVEISDDRIKVLNNDMIETKTFASKESFKLLIPYDAIVDNQLSVKVRVIGNFMEKVSYIYGVNGAFVVSNNQDFTAKVMPLANQVPYNSNTITNFAILDKLYEDVSYDELNWNYNIKLGNVTISKIDSENRTHVSGATLVINDSLGNQVVTFETIDSDQTFSLPEGSYTITEVKIPEGYAVENNVTNFMVESNKKNNVVIENTRTMEVPNTVANNSYLYVIGGSLIIVGIILVATILFSKRRQKDQ